MRKLPFFAILVLLLFLACHRRNETDELLQHAQNLIEAYHPDSAQTLLENSIDLYSSLNAEQNARYAVLMTQVRNKNYVKQTSDSLIRIAIEYYDANPRKNVAMRAAAHYYYGVVQREMGNQLGAVKQYLKALPLAKEVDDKKLQSLIVANLGVACYYNDLNVEADSLFREAATLCEAVGDTLGWTFNLNYLSNAIIEKDITRFDESENYLLQALSLYQQSGRKRLSTERCLVRTLVFLYERVDSVDKALCFARQKMTLDANKRDSLETYLILGSIYCKRAMYDSASHYLHQAIHSTKLSTKTGAYLRLADVAEARRDDKTAHYYNKLYHQHLDSLDNSRNPVVVVSTINKELKSQLLQTHQEERAHLENHIWLIIGLCALALTCVLVFVVRYMCKSSMPTADVDSQLSFLCDEINIDERALYTSDVFVKFKRASWDLQVQIEKSDWDELATLFDAAYPTIVSHLNAFMSLKKAELDISMLIKLGFTPGQIACITKKSKQSISSMRKRIYLKMFGRKEKPEIWDEYVRSL